MPIRQVRAAWPTRLALGQVERVRERRDDLGEAVAGVVVSGAVVDELHARVIVARAGALEPAGDD